jgi:Na+/proline symporter
MQVIENNTIDAVIIILYLTLSLIVVFWNGFNVKTLREYAIGTREFSVFVVVSLMLSTCLDGTSVLSPYKNAYENGIISIYPCLGIVFCLYFYSLMAPLMKPYLRTITTGEIVGMMYGREARIIAGLAVTLRCFGVLSVQIFIMSNIFDYLLHVSKFDSMLISITFLSFYTSFGGKRSPVLSDKYDFLVKFLMTLLIIYFCFEKTGGVYRFLASLPATHITIIQDDITLLSFTIIFLYFLIPGLYPNIIQEMLIAKNLTQISKSFKISSIVALYSLLFFILVGLFSYEIFPERTTKYLFISLIDEVLPSFVKGIVICVILSIIISLAELNLNIASVSLTNDILKLAYKNKTEIDLLFYSRIISLFLSSFSAIVAYSYSNLFDIIILLESFWRPVVNAPLLLGLLGLRSSSKNFKKAALSGSITFLLLYYLEPFNNMNGLYSLLTGGIVNGVVLFSLTKGSNIRRILKQL